MLAKGAFLFREGKGEKEREKKKSITVKFFTLVLDSTVVARVLVLGKDGGEILEKWFVVQNREMKRKQERQERTAAGKINKKGSQKVWVSSWVFYQGNSSFHLFSYFLFTFFSF